MPTAAGRSPSPGEALPFGRVDLFNPVPFAYETKRGEISVHREPAVPRHDRLFVSEASRVQSRVCFTKSLKNMKYIQYDSPIDLVVSVSA